MLRRPTATWDALHDVRTVVIDQVVPASGDAYDAQVAARKGHAGVHLVFYSSPRSGATLHLLGSNADLSELPDASLVHERRVLPAHVVPDLATPQP